MMSDAYTVAPGDRVQVHDGHRGYDTVWKVTSIRGLYAQLVTDTDGLPTVEVAIPVDWLVPVSPQESEVIEW